MFICSIYLCVIIMSLIVLSFNQGKTKFKKYLYWIFDFWLVYNFIFTCFFHIVNFISKNLNIFLSTLISLKGFGHKNVWMKSMMPLLIIKNLKISYAENCSTVFFIELFFNQTISPLQILYFRSMFSFQWPFF